MGRRSRQRARAGDAPAPLSAPASEYRSPAGDTVLELRGALTPATRREYAAVLHDQARSTEDTWQRAVEFLFERLAVRWEVDGVAWEGQRELLDRYRMASQTQRRFVRDALREHLTEHFPDVEAP
jgi:surface antigen